MLISRIDNQLLINDQDVFEWMEIFDSGLVNEIQINLNEGNMDFFYPNWRKLYDPDSLADTLDESKADRFGSIRVTIADNVKFRDGEGEYEVESFAIAFPVDDRQDCIDIPLGAKALARIFYKVTPDIQKSS